MAGRKKTVVEKIAKAVDKIIHPNSAPVVEKPVKVKKESSKAESDYANHPKFAKFLKKGAE